MNTRHPPPPGPRVSPRAGRVQRPDAAPAAWCAVLAALAVVTASPAARALPPASWLVAIGNDMGAPDEEALRFAERDARELAEVLRTEGGVSTRRTVLLLGEDADTVRRELLRVSQEIRATARGTETPSALVVFYSGHADGDALHLGGTTLPNDELRALVAVAPASVRLLIVDACRSGAVTRVKGVQPAEPFRIDFGGEAAAEGLAIITSSAAGEKSQESDRLRGSFFSHHLVNGLRGAADRDGDRQVTLAEAYGYAYEQTLRASGRTFDVQHPTYEYDVRGRGELVLTSPGAGVSRTGVLRLADAGLYLISERSGAGPLVAEVAPAAAGARIALPASAYFVQNRRAREFREYQVTLAAGQEVDLAAAPYHAEAYDRLVRRRGGERFWVQELTLVAGGRGELLAGEGPSPHLVVGWGADLPWLSLGLRLRGALVARNGAGAGLPRRHWELGLGLVVQRYLDLRWLSLSFGLLVEGVFHHQTFDSAGVAPARSSAGVSFGGFLALERQLGKGLSLRLEGGPQTCLFERAVSTAEAGVREEWASPFTWWVAGGLVWRP